MTTESVAVPLHDAIARGLMDLGATTMFALTGSGNIHIADSYAREHGGQLIRAAHESGLMHMVHGYGSRTNALSAATISPGPGLTNAMTGLVECVRGHLPVIVVLTDTARTDKFHWQNIEHRGLVEATGAGFEELRSPKHALRDLSRAVQRAVVESRPFVLNVPADLLFETLQYDQAAVIQQEEPWRRHVTAADALLLEDAAGMLAGARRPLIVAGRGAIEARDELVALSRSIGAPLMTSLKAKDLFRGEPNSLGILGTLSTTQGLEAIARSDVVLAIGVSLNYRTTLGGELLGDTKIIHCDVDPSRVGDTLPVDLPVVADAQVFAAQLVDLLSQAELERSPTGWAKPPARNDVSEPENPQPFTTDAVMKFLDETVEKGRTVVTDGGNFALSAWTVLNVEHPTKFVTTLDFGAIGGGVGNGIGAAVAATEENETVLVVCGDGGFALGGVAEFHTAVREELNMIVAVCNNEAYGPEVQQLARRGVDTDIALFRQPDFAAVARSLGGEGVNIQGPDDLADAAKAIANHTRPLLLDFRLDAANDGQALAVKAS